MVWSGGSAEQGMKNMSCPVGEWEEKNILEAKEDPKTDGYQVRMRQQVVRAIVISELGD